MVVSRRFFRACLVGLSLLVLGGPSVGWALPGEPVGCPPGSGDGFPFLTKQELRCNKTIVNAAFEYLDTTQLARHDCLQEEAAGNYLRRDVDCLANVDFGTGLVDLDNRLRRSEAVLTRRILTKCTNIALENMGFPGFCPDPNGAPFDAFDLNSCMLTSLKDLSGYLMDFEYPPFPGFLDLNQRVCRDIVGRHSSRMNRAEMRDRGRCLFKQLARRSGFDPEYVDCRAQVDPQDPQTGRRITDNQIVQAHNFILRGIPNNCPRTNLAAVGYPDRCPFPDNDSIFPLPELTECMFRTHDDSVWGLLDIMFPCSSLCGNGFLDLVETCDDGDITFERGDLCRNNCSRVACGDPDDNQVFNATDALYILRTAVNLESCSLQVCDVTGDFTINATDALLHLMFDVHLPVEFNCPFLSGTCGNGAIEELEECDDGDDSYMFGDFCDSACLRVNCGDTDNNNRVTVIDALYILHASVGNQECSPSICDVNNNGKVNSLDALRVLMNIVHHNLQPELICPEP